jgi:hypothetical protein
MKGNPEQPDYFLFADQPGALLERLRAGNRPPI